MTMLIIGVTLFFLLHLIPFFGTGIRDKAASAIGAGPYKGLFALATLGSFVFMVLGWQATEITHVYTPPSWGPMVTPLFVLVAFILFIASNAPTNIRRILRHPQLVSVFFWGIGHLLSNGENRSIVLFVGLMIFATSAIIGSNKRDGEWVKRDKVSFVSDLVTVTIAVALFSGFAYFHEWIIGVPVLLF